MKITRLAGLLGAAVLLATTTAACGGGGAGSPEEAAEGVLKAVVNEDNQAGCEVTLKDDKVRTDEQVDECVKEADKSAKEAEKALKDMDDETRKASEEMTKEQKKVFKKVLDEGPKKVGEEKDGKVDVVYEYEGQKLTINTRKIDGNWYVADLT